LGCFSLTESSRTNRNKDNDIENKPKFQKGSTHFYPSTTTTQLNIQWGLLNYNAIAFGYPHLKTIFFQQEGLGMGGVHYRLMYIDSTGIFRTLPDWYRLYPLIKSQSGAQKWQKYGLAEKPRIRISGYILGGIYVGKAVKDN